jgi:L-lactate dehydrogenase complex protein LldG
MTMSSREQILGRLRQRKSLPFANSTPPETHQPVVPLSDRSAAALQTLFVEEALKAGCVIHEADSPAAAIAAILEIVGGDTAVSAWNPAHIPLPCLVEALDKAGITRVEQDAGVRVGLTGVDAALAATGSVVVVSGNGRVRAASLLPPIHIAVVVPGQIMPDLESWWATQRAAGLEQIRRHSNVVVITGPSRTADIAMQLVMGMHGPRELHLVLLSF